MDSKEYRKRYKERINRKFGLGTKQFYKYGFKLCIEIYNKFNHKCDICGSTDYLQIHHLDNTGNTKEINNNPDNLQLLCRKCHGSISSKEYWNKNKVVKGNFDCKTKENKKLYTKEYRRIIKESKKK